jgi:N-acetylmuramoyl-L-alanine amidase
MSHPQPKGDIVKRLLVFSFLLLTSATAQDSLFLRIIVPGRDTVRTGTPRYRVSGSTLPGARVLIQNKEAAVVRTGAFGGAFTLSGDTSVQRILAIGPAGDSLTRDFVFIRPERPRTSPRDTLVIEDQMMRPSEDLWLTVGDVIETRFKGSPGWKATFSIPDVESGIPMRELSPGEAGGLSGIYVGRYVVKPGDEVSGAPIEFKLKRSFFSRVSAESRAKVWISSDSLPRTAEVVGRKPFLNVGLGSDRLGGAKLGYLQPGALIRITGRVGDQFRVRLSESMQAWIPDSFVRLLPVHVPAPSSLTGSISVTGTDAEDVVIVGLSTRLPYTSDQLTDPNAIIVDVFGATSNTNWITHHLSAQGIASIKWNQVEADRYRLTIGLKHRQHWGHDIEYLGTSLRIRIRRPPPAADPARPLLGSSIAIDAGHGGSNRGALGSTGIQEADLTLAMALQLDSILTARGVRTVMTRRNDDGPGMLDRADTVVASGAHILVSIHCNSTGETSDPTTVAGTSTYYRYDGFKPLADIVYDRLLTIGLKPWGVVGSFNFSLNGPTQLPNVLVETAFLSNPEDEMLLLDPDFRRRLAEQVADGVERFVRERR